MRTISQTDFARRIISRYMPPDSSAPDSVDMLLARGRSIDRLVQSVRNTYLINRTIIENRIFNLHIQLSFLNSVFDRTLREIHESAARHIQMLEKRPAPAVGRNALPIAAPDQSSLGNAGRALIALQRPLPSTATATGTRAAPLTPPSTHRLAADATAQGKSAITADKLGHPPRVRAEERKEQRLGIPPSKAILPVFEQQRGRSADPSARRSGIVDFVWMSELAPVNLISLPEFSSPGLQHVLSAFWGEENGVPVRHRQLWGSPQTGRALPGAFDPQGLEPRATRRDSLAPVSIARTMTGRFLPEAWARTATEQVSRTWEHSLAHGLSTYDSAAARPGKNIPPTGLGESSNDLRRSEHGDPQRLVVFPDAGKTAAIPDRAAPTTGTTRQRPTLSADMQKPHERTTAELFTRRATAAQPMRNIFAAQPAWNISTVQSAWRIPAVQPERNIPAAQPEWNIPAAQPVPDGISSIKGLSAPQTPPPVPLRGIFPPTEAAWLLPKLLHTAQGLAADPADAPDAAQRIFDISIRREPPVFLPRWYAAASQLREQAPRQGGTTFHAGTLPPRRSARIDPPFTPPPFPLTSRQAVGTSPVATDVPPRVMPGVKASNAPLFQYTAAAPGFVSAGRFMSIGANSPPSGGTANAYTEPMSMISPYAAEPDAFAQSPGSGQPPQASGSQSPPVPIVYKREASQPRQTEPPPGIGEDIEFIKKAVKQPGKTQVTTNTAINLPGGTHYRDAAQNPADFRSIDGQVNAIADKVYRALERRLRSERMRKGML